MEKRMNTLKNLAVIALVFTCFIACDKDFADIESDIINNENASHFSTGSSLYDVIARTKVLGPVQTNNLPLNALGIYNDPNFGKTTASFVTELESSTIDPSFGENTVLDSVVLTIPYFSTATEISDEGVPTFRIDSLFGDSPIKVSLFENNYFLRDFNPSGDEVNQRQLYYSNRSTGIDNISTAQLEGTPILQVADNPLDFSTTNLSSFLPNPNQIVLKDGDDMNTTLSPALRVKLRPEYWQEKIIDKENQPELSNQNNFNDYFRGIYFKVEELDSNAGNMILLNLASSNANIVLYYTRDNANADADPVQSTYVLNFSSYSANGNNVNGNRVNFIENEFELNDGDSENGDENLFLKGQQGSIAEIDLFGGDDIDDDQTTMNAFETFKNEFAETDDAGMFVRSKKLINEANLVFYVNQDLVDGEEPDRLYLYDATNNKILTDYLFDRANDRLPLFSRINHLGILERDGTTNDGIRYKMRITEHLKNLVRNDSTNVTLGLAVSANVNLENQDPFAETIQRKVLTEDESQANVPVSSIIYPRGTVLYGNNTTNEEKKLYLEIFFTEPN